MTQGTSESTMQVFARRQLDALRDEQLLSELVAQLLSELVAYLQQRYGFSKMLRTYHVSHSWLKNYLVERGVDFKEVQQEARKLSVRSKRPRSPLNLSDPNVIGIENVLTKSATSEHRTVAN